MKLRGMRVMVVEDEALVSMMLEAYLTELGCDVVVSAARLNEAMEKAASAALDLVMLDINLDGELSYPVAEVLRSRGIPFVFATGYGSTGLPSSLQDSLVLLKPFNQKQLAAALLAVTAG